MLNFVDSFLTDRTFSVKINGFLSPRFQQKNGVPQGSTLSVRLFLFSINSITKDIKFPVKYSLFTNDFNIYRSESIVLSTQIFLQEKINTLSDCPDKTDFSFSPEKSQCIFFSIPVDFNLKMKYNNP